MAGSMSEADLVTDLKASLLSAAEPFKAASDADFKRHLSAAALDFSRARPRTLVGSITLIADQPDYAAPAGFHAFKALIWGEDRRDVQPWEKHWPGRLPIVREAEVGGTKKLYLDPAPTGAQISVLGADCKFYYYGVHAIHATDGAQTTIKAGDRSLLLLRAQAEAMRELSIRNTNKAVQLRDGLNFQTRNGTPTAIYQALMVEFQERIAA